VIPLLGLIGAPRFLVSSVASISSHSRSNPCGTDPGLDLFQTNGETRGVPTAAEFERMVRGVGLRVTRPRLAVLSAVHQRPHADTDALVAAVRGDSGGVSRQAVYDVLRDLTAAGLVRRFEPAGSVARYEPQAGDNHHHLVCRSCGAISDVDCAVGEAPCLSPSADAGFEIGEAEVIYWGRCPDCLSAGAR
jgi:Fe2+ or Zn2+ uptake regulation protein